VVRHSITSSARTMSVGGKSRPSALVVFYRGTGAIPVDVIVADATPATRGALDATRTIPIVIGVSGDPVLLGFVASGVRSEHPPARRQRHGHVNSHRQ
jgi:hypothetical protein